MLSTTLVKTAPMRGRFFSADFYFSDLEGVLFQALCRVFFMRPEGAFFMISDK